MDRFLEGTVGQSMTRQVKTVARTTTLRELEGLFAKPDFNAFPVLEGNEMIGFVTKFDFLTAFAFPTGQLLPQYDELMKRTVGEVGFRKDARWVHDRTTAEHGAFLNRLALSLLRGDTGKSSLKVKRKRAGWHLSYLAQLLGFCST